MGLAERTSRPFRRGINVLVIAWGRTPLRRGDLERDDPLDRLLERVAALVHRDWRDLQAPYLLRFIRVYMSAVWPLRALLRIAVYSRRYATRARVQSGNSIGQQVGDQLGLALLRRLDPTLYYRYELFTENRLRQAERYLTGNMASALFPILNNFKATTVLRYKDSTAAALSRQGLPTVPELARLPGAASPRRSDRCWEIPREDFVIKPNGGKQGTGIHGFDFLGDGQWRDADQRRYAEAGLREHISELAGGDDYLVQPRLRNHAALAGLSGGGLSTVRVVSGRLPGTDAEIVTAVFKMPVGGSVADNFAARGIAAPIDLSTGILGRAVSKVPLSGFRDQHPDTGHPIPGVVLPDWNRVISLAIAAHGCIEDFVFLGWDIGVLDDGPVILETNVLWDVDLLQRPHMAPLACGKFLEICDHRLRQIHN